MARAGVALTKQADFNDAEKNRPRYAQVGYAPASESGDFFVSWDTTKITTLAHLKEALTQVELFGRMSGLK